MLSVTLDAVVPVYRRFSKAWHGTGYGPLAPQLALKKGAIHTRVRVPPQPWKRSRTRYARALKISAVPSSTRNQEGSGT